MFGIDWAAMVWGAIDGFFEGLLERFLVVLTEAFRMLAEDAAPSLTAPWAQEQWGRSLRLGMLIAVGGAIARIVWAAATKGPGAILAVAGKMLLLGPTLLAVSSVFTFMHSLSSVATSYVIAGLPANAADAMSNTFSTLTQAAGAGGGPALAGLILGFGAAVAFASAIVIVIMLYTFGILGTGIWLLTPVLLGAAMFPGAGRAVRTGFLLLVGIHLAPPLVGYALQMGVMPLTTGSGAGLPEAVAGFGMTIVAACAPWVIIAAALKATGGVQMAKMLRAASPVTPAYDMVGDAVKHPLKTAMRMSNAANLSKTAKATGATAESAAQVADAVEDPPDWWYDLGPNATAQPDRHVNANPLEHTAGWSERGLPAPPKVVDGESEDVTVDGVFVVDPVGDATVVDVTPRPTSGVPGTPMPAEQRSTPLELPAATAEPTADTAVPAATSTSPVRPVGGYDTPTVGTSRPAATQPPADAGNVIADTDPLAGLAERIETPRQLDTTPNLTRRPDDAVAADGIESVSNNPLPKD